MQKAKFCTSKDGYVQCNLCSHQCKITEGKRGVCKVRENIDGKVFSRVYGKVVAENIDPIEKKPLFHVLPGTLSYSISTRGCNFRCLHCQNASISQVERTEDPARFCKDRSPEEIVASAVSSGCRSISYTYVEPTIFYEYAYDCSVLAVENGLKNIFVSNGYMSGAATRELASVLTAINIDIKSFSDDFYRKICGARLQPVLDTVQLMHELGVWVEVTTLLIPGKNDSTEELKALAKFIANVDVTIPWHVTAFYPTHKMLEPPRTSLEILERAYQIGIDSGLQFVYEGNIPGSGGESTSCPGCKSVVVSRRGFSIEKNSLADGKCPECSTSIPGVWK